MHHNLKIEIERINNQFVTQIELSTFGKCGRARLVSETFKQALKDLDAKHDELFQNALGFHQEGNPASNITHPSEFRPAQTQVGTLKPKKLKKAKKARAAKKPAAASPAASKPKEAARNFAAPPV